MSDPIDNSAEQCVRDVFNKTLPGFYACLQNILVPMGVTIGDYKNYKYEVSCSLTYGNRRIEITMPANPGKERSSVITFMRNYSPIRGDYCNPLEVFGVFNRTYQEVRDYFRAEAANRPAQGPATDTNPKAGL